MAIQRLLNPNGDMRALVTGSAGFIGQHLLESFKEQEIEVLEFDRVYGTHQNLALAVSFEGLTKAVQQVDQVVHLAGVANPEKHADPLVAKGDIRAALRVMDACMEANKPLVVASSAYAITQNTHYGLTKSVIEMMAGMYQRTNAPVSVARFFNVFGPGQEHAITYDSVVTLNLIRSFSQGNYVVKTNAQRDFVYVSDVVDSLHDIMRRTIEGQTGVFEVGSGRLTSILELAEIIGELLGVRGRIEYLNQRPQGTEFSPIGQDPYERAADPPVLAPKVTLREGLRNTIANLLEW